MEESYTTRWVVIGLVCLGLVGYGYKVYSDQKTRPAQENRGPVSVAAIRGGHGDTRNPVGAMLNMSEEYVDSLKDDKALAQDRANTYEAAAKAREAEIQKSLDDLN